MNEKRSKSNFKNVSYIFVPFSFDEKYRLEKITGLLNRSGKWEKMQDDIKYMFKFITDKLKPAADKKESRSVHYVLNDNMDRCMNKWFSYKKGNEKYSRARFTNMHLYCFATNVFILAMEMQFENCDPFEIAAMQYEIKKISRTKVRIDGSKEEFTLLGMAKELVAELDCLAPKFFFYSNEGQERANTFTYLDMHEKESYDKELFYLKWCYHSGFSYDEKADSGNSENYIAAKDKVWGISPSAAVCLGCPEKGDEAFLHGTFYKNFKKQYLFMYILLLHQKYVMYRFLTELDVEEKKHVKKLESYRDRLYKFEADFIFSHISETPQYQLLYEKISQAFALDAMFKDVHEPLTALTEMKGKKSENKMNAALSTLSLLAIVSGFADAFAAVDNIEEFFTEITMFRAIGIMSVVLIVVVFIVNWIRGAMEK